MPNLPHLPLPQKIERKNYLGNQINRKKSSTTQQNLDNRQAHKSTLDSSLQGLESAWKYSLDQIAGTPLEERIPHNVVPIFLKIDTAGFTPDQLRGFGIEVIAEESDGMIIGASVDSLQKLKLKIERFANNSDKGTAYLWEIDNGIGWKREMILSTSLNENIDLLPPDSILDLDISIACNIHVPDKPIQKQDETNDRYKIRLDRWERKFLERDKVRDERLEHFKQIISIYGSVLNEYDYNDSLGLRVTIRAKGVFDILFNYSYVFEIVEHDYLENVFATTSENGTTNVQIAPPNQDSPKICVIDSGIMEGHRLLEPAIDKNASKCYVPNENTVADFVPGGGHGTRVAGAALFPNGINGDGDSLQLPFWIQNARILDNNNKLSENIFLPTLMQQILIDYHPTKIYNLSVSSAVPCRVNHMSLWAASLDKLIWENDVLFIVAVGNIGITGSTTRPGIKDYLVAGHNYPDFLLTQQNCRIANPSQSSFALSVGSVTIGEYEDEYKISFGKMLGNHPAPSPFSRTGLGLWGMIKPDVVEFGGDMVREKGQNPNVTEHHTTSPQLVKSIQTSIEAVGKDKVGTSFSAPKVSHLVATLQATFPTGNCLFYRGLVVQSARLPEYAFNNPNTDHLRHFGYGIPNLQRAIENSQNRVTLYTNGAINAKHTDIYSVKIPPELNRPGEDFRVLVEVTLSYKASPRRTRMRTRSYLSTWLDWLSSKNGEPLQEFHQRVININEVPEESTGAEGQNNGNDARDTPEYPEIPWKIRERTNWGDYRSVKRQDSTLQKDWVVLAAHELPEEICFAVLGHRGWGYDLEQEIPYAFFVSFEIITPEVNIDIYQNIKIANEVRITTEIRV